MRKAKISDSILYNNKDKIRRHFQTDEFIQTLHNSGPKPDNNFSYI